MALAGWLIAATAAGMETRHGDTVIVGPDEVVEDDLYALGRVVRIDGEVRGDAILLGRSVEVAGRVDGDLVAAGRTVLVEGVVADDVRAVGGDLRLGPGAQVDGDWVGAAGELEAEEGSAVAGDVSLTGGRLRLAGRVGGDVSAGAAALRLDGPVAGTVTATVGGGATGGREAEVPVPAGLTVGPGAEIATLRYRAPAEARIDPAAQVERTDATLSAAPTVAARVSAVARRYLGLLLVGGILLLAAPALADRAAARVSRRLLPSLGAGLLALAAWLAAAVTGALIVLTVAWVFAVAGFGAFAVLLLGLGVTLALAWVLALVLATGWVGHAIVARALGGAVLRPRGLALVLGLAVLVLAAAVPAVGPVVAALAAIVGLGALVTNRAGERISPARSAPPGTALPAPG